MAGLDALGAGVRLLAGPVMVVLQHHPLHARPARGPPGGRDPGAGLKA
jgi:hypothetical protein